MSDLIERENVLDAICDNCKLETNFDRYKACGNCKDVKMIMDIPSAERKGEWIQNNLDGTFKIWDCSECGIHMETKWNFCPNCGARMKGVEDGTR